MPKQTSFLIGHCYLKSAPTSSKHLEPQRCYTQLARTPPTHTTKQQKHHNQRQQKEKERRSYSKAFRWSTWKQPAKTTRNTRNMTYRLSLSLSLSLSLYKCIHVCNDIIQKLINVVYLISCLVGCTSSQFLLSQARLLLHQVPFVIHVGRRLFKRTGGGDGEVANPMEVLVSKEVFSGF